MEQAAHQEKSHAAFSYVLWSAFLTGIKLWAGIVPGSLGIISAALHSGLDLMAAAMTFYAVKVAARPADESHPYCLLYTSHGFRKSVKIIIRLP